MAMIPYNPVAWTFTTPGWWPQGLNVSEYPALDFLFNTSEYFYKRSKNKKKTDLVTRPPEKGSASNPKTQTFDWAALKAQGSDVQFEMIGSTIAMASGMVGRVELFFDFNSSINAYYNPADQSKKMVFSQWKWRLHFYSAKDFMVIPFLVLMEPGGNITNTDVSSISLKTALESGLPAVDHSTVLLKSIQARHNPCYYNADRVYNAEYTVDLADVASEYAKHWFRKEIQGESPLVLQMGLFVRFKSYAQSVYWAGSRFISYHEVPRNMLEAL